MLHRCDEPMILRGGTCRRIGRMAVVMSASSLAVLLWATGAMARVSHVSGGRAHSLSGGRAGRAAATLDVVSGVTSVEVSAGTRPGLLYRVSTPAGSGIRPFATLDRGTLRVGQAASGTRSGVATIDIQLALGVRWTINLDGGASTETVNMTKGSVSSIVFGAGVAMASVRLPAAVGTLTVTLAGGATQLVLVAPAGEPAEVKVVGGASDVSLDGTSHVGVAGGSVFTEPAWPDAHNRYSIDLVAGVSSFQMSRG
jgi:hypothetical protein